MSVAPFVQMLRVTLVHVVVQSNQIAYRTVAVRRTFLEAADMTASVNMLEHSKDVVLHAL